MAGELVFITGATGFVGFAVLNDLLKAGYRVRISVRKESNIASLKSKPALAPFADKLEFVIVPDITVEGAFDKVLDGVVYIEHIASPLPRPTEDVHRDIILPAIHGTTSILTSALKAASVKRVVITSSLVAIVPGDALANGDMTNVYGPNSRVSPLPTAPWGTDIWGAYRNAKVLALDATDRFITTNHPPFSIINIMPGYVLGSNALATTAPSLVEGSNALVLSLLLGSVAASPKPATISHLRDVARIHVGALDFQKVPRSTSIVVDAGKIRLEDAKGVVQKYFPDAVQKGVLKLDGSQPDAHIKFDNSATVEVFGELDGYEEAVKDLVGQFIALSS